jgi:hypothetical protein
VPPTCHPTAVRNIGGHSRVSRAPPSHDRACRRQSNAGAVGGVQNRLNAVHALGVWSSTHPRTKVKTGRARCLVRSSQPVSGCCAVSHTWHMRQQEAGSLLAKSKALLQGDQLSQIPTRSVLAPRMVDKHDYAPKSPRAKKSPRTSWPRVDSDRPPAFSTHASGEVSVDCFLVLSCARLPVAARAAHVARVKSEPPRLQQADTPCGRVLQPCVRKPTAGPEFLGAPSPSPSCRSSKRCHARNRTQGDIAGTWMTLAPASASQWQRQWQQPA